MAAASIATARIAALPATTAWRPDISLAEETGVPAFALPVDPGAAIP